MSIDNGVRLRRNRIMSLLTVDVLNELVETFEAVKQDNLEDPHMPPELQKQIDDELKLKIDVLKDVLMEEADVVEGFDQEDRDNYKAVIDRIDEMAGC